MKDEGNMELSLICVGSCDETTDGTGVGNCIGDTLFVVKDSDDMGVRRVVGFVLGIFVNIAVGSSVGCSEGERVGG